MLTVSDGSNTVHDGGHGNAVITDAAHDTITPHNVTVAQLHQSDFLIVRSKRELRLPVGVTRFESGGKAQQRRPKPSTAGLAESMNL